MYQALYRKWRPARFADVVGQQHIVTALQNQLASGKTGHAYLFTGTRGTGKTSCAKIFAKALNCPHRENGEPCGKCDICLGIDEGHITDVSEIDAASNNGVDSIRELRDETAYIPGVCAYKVYIIDEVHMLSIAAFNALLKIMEEPPAHVVFILATTEIHKVPATILSRCQRYDFTRITAEDIAAQLSRIAEQEKISLTADAAGLIARLADGAMRDALSILDTCASVGTEVDEELVRRMAGITDRSYLFECSAAIAAHDAPAALALIARLRERSVDMKRLCGELVLHYRNLLLAGVPGGKGLLSGVCAEEEARYYAEAPGVPQQEAARAIRVFAEAGDRMGKSADARIELELAVFTLCGTAAPIAAPVAVQPVAAPVTAPPVAVQPRPAVAEPAPPAPVEAEDIPPPRAAQAAPSSPPKPAAAPQREAPASASAPAEAPPTELFARWDDVVEAMQEKDKLLYVNLRSSKAYLSGKRILIDGGDLFLDYMRKNEFSSKLLKDTIAEVTGTRYAIGPYPHAPQQKSGTMGEDALAQLEALGVPVIYNDEKEQ